MTERVCQTCGAPIVEKRNTRRKFCSERCRKSQYGDPCIECGAKTRYGAEAARVPEPRCDSCSRRRKSDIRVGRVLTMLQLRRTTSMTNVDIGRELGIPTNTIATELHRLRALGFDVPVSPYQGGGVGRSNLVARQVWDEPTATLAAALVERGHHVPAFDGEAAA